MFVHRAKSQSPKCRCVSQAPISHFVWLYTIRPMKTYSKCCMANDILIKQIRPNVVVSDILPHCIQQKYWYIYKKKQLLTLSSLFVWVRTGTQMRKWNWLCNIHQVVNICQKKLWEKHDLCFELPEKVFRNNSIRVYIRSSNNPSCIQYSTFIIIQIISLFDFDDVLNYGNFRNDVYGGFMHLQELTIRNYNYTVIQISDLLLFGGAFHWFHRWIYSSVRTLDLSCNYLTDISIFIYFDHAEFKFMNLSWNKIEFIQKGAFRNMYNLAEVDLSHNVLINLPLDSSYRNLNRYTHQNSFGYIAELNILNLSNNHLRSIPVTLFSQNKRLGILDLTSNGMIQVEEMVFYNLVELVTLDISGNHLHKLSFGESLLDNGLVEHQEVINCSLSIFQGLINLRTLNVSQNNVTHLSQNAFCHLTRLEILDLAWNHIDFLSCNVFENLGNLTCLILRGNQIRTIESSTFLSLHELNSISLEANRLSDLSDTLFDASSKLTSLQLHNNNLTKVPLVVSKWIHSLFWIFTLG